MDDGQLIMDNSMCVSQIALFVKRDEESVAR